MKYKKLLIILFIIIGVFIISCKKDYSSLLDEAYSSIELPAETKDNLDFPTSIEVSGSLINAKFTTTSPNLTPSGVVTRSDEDEVVLVSVELSYANQSKNYVIGEIIIKKIEKYTISYDLDGGILNEELQTTFLEDEEVVLPTPEKYGFTFLGWYEGNQYITQIKNKNYNLIAKWTKTVYHITYDLDGGVCDSSLVVLFGEDMEVILPTPYKEGFEFIGWYENNKQVVHIENRDYNLVAIYAMKKYTIIYELNGGTCDDLITSFKEGDVIELPVPTQENRKFLGWWDGTEYINIINTPKDYYLKAIWDKSGTLMINKDVDVCYVGGDAYFSIDGIEEKEYSKYNWEFDYPELVSFDSDYVAKFLGKGSVKLTVTYKEDPSITGSITFDILNALPKISLSKNIIFVNDEFSALLDNYDNDISLFNITIGNEKILKYENNSFTALENGKTTVIFTLIDDDKCSITLDVTVYEKAPLLQTITTDLFVGDVVRLDVVNYPDRDDYYIGFSDPSVLALDGNKITALSEGKCIVKVTLSSDSLIYTELSFNVFPVKPKLLLGESNMLVGDKARVMITNLDDLEYQDLEDYEVSISNGTVASVNDFIITALAEGEVVISVTNKHNALISNTINLKVSRTSSIRDVNGEIAVGPLFLKMTHENSMVHAGEIGYITIDGAKDIENYTLTSSDIQICRVFENGQYTAVRKGFVTLFAFNKQNREIVGTISFEVYGEPNVDYIGRLISVAENEIGYREKGDNGTKYGDWYPLPGEAWCAMFVSWCADRAGIGTDVIPKYCGCTAGMQWFVERGQFGYKGQYTPKAGDIIFFLSAGASHTGIVIACDGVKVYTIEGNTSDMVAKREYYLYTDIITGYGIPNYPEFNGEAGSGDTSGSTSGVGEKTD